MNLVAVSNFRREIFSAAIVPFEINPTDERRSVYMLEIRGIAFLWHMIRCIMAVLLYVGEGLEAPDIVAQLLNVELNPAKPQFNMADEAGLVLQECTFDRVQFFYEPERLWRLMLHYEEVFNGHYLEAMKALNAMRLLEALAVRSSDVAAMELKWCRRDENPLMKRARDEPFSSDTIPWGEACQYLRTRNCRLGDRQQNHVPLLQRSRAPTYEARVQELASTNKRYVPRSSDVRSGFAWCLRLRCWNVTLRQKIERNQQMKDEAQSTAFFDNKRKAGSIHLDQESM